MDLKTQSLGKGGERLSCGSSEEVRAIGTAMASQCRRTLDICGRQLDPHVFDNVEFANVVKALAISSRFARIRLLVLQPEQLYTRGHQLLLLAHELPTFIHVRVPSKLDSDFNEAILIADDTGYIHRRLSDRYEGIAHFNDRAYARDLARRFDALWEHGMIDQNFRRLGI
jgi:hypothetical protein